jgi:hypothetical protein
MKSMVQEAKSPVKYLVRQCCTEEFNSGIKGLILITMFSVTAVDTTPELLPCFISNNAQMLTLLTCIWDMHTSISVDDTDYTAVSVDLLSLSRQSSGHNLKKEIIITSTSFPNVHQSLKVYTLGYRMHWPINHKIKNTTTVSPTFQHNKGKKNLMFYCYTILSSHPALVLHKPKKRKTINAPYKQKKANTIMLTT